MSHSQDLLCMAIPKERFELFDEKFLKNNWKIEFAD